MTKDNETPNFVEQAKAWRHQQTMTAGEDYIANLAFLAGCEHGYRVGKAEIENLKELLYHSEQWRQAYRRGKLELYAKGGEVADAAMSHLPCSEGPLERSAVKALGERTGWIELKHYDQLRQQLAERSDESLFKAFAEALGIEDAHGWTTGQHIIRALTKHPQDGAKGDL